MVQRKGHLTTITVQTKRIPVILADSRTGAGVSVDISLLRWARLGRFRHILSSLLVSLNVKTIVRLVLDESPPKEVITQSRYC